MTKYSEKFKLKADSLCLITKMVVALGTSPALALRIGLSGELSVADESILFILVLSARLAFEPTLDWLLFFISRVSEGLDDLNSVTIIILTGTVIAADITATYT